MTAAALAELLRDSTDLVAGPLRAEVATLPEQVRPVVAHHFGWRGPHDPHGALGGGKAVRPALVLLSAAAAGAPLEVAVPGAVAVELVHNFSLLHDDVMDGDRSWRHRPSAWVVFGERLALLAGSALLVRSQVCVLSAPSGPAAARRLERTVQDLIECQALDLALESSGDASFDLWLRMAERKTAALVSTSAALGAVLGEGPWSTGRRPVLVRARRRPGVPGPRLPPRHLGGPPRSPESPPPPTFAGAKRRFPSSPSLEQGGAVAEELAELLSAPQRSDGDIERMAGLVERAGGRAATEAAAAAWVAEALDVVGSAAIGTRWPTVCAVLPAPAGAAGDDGRWAVGVGGGRREGEATVTTSR
jgi:geranylgeranyl diphosphate synthase type I